LQIQRWDPPHIFKQLKLDEEPPSIHLHFGNAIHAAAEGTIEDGWGPEKRAKFFKHDFKKKMADTMKDTEDYKQVEDFVKQGINILYRIDFGKLLEEYDIVSVEEPLYEVIFDNFHFKGFIDLVLRHKKTGRYLIVDWKTAGEKWNMYWKMKDKIFLMQMRLYKYFWARKNNVPIDDIDTQYIVLERLKNKKDPNSGFGGIEVVPMPSNKQEIMAALKLMSSTIKNIHIDQDFKKAKFVLDRGGNLQLDGDGQTIIDPKPCRFCKFKDGTHPFCNNNYDQDKALLKEHGQLF